MQSPGLPQEEQLCQDEGGGGILRWPSTKPLLIGTVRIQKTIHMKELSSPFYIALMSLFGFVLLQQHLALDMHINTCFIHASLE